MKHFLFSIIIANSMTLCLSADSLAGKYDLTDTDVFTLLRGSLNFKDNPEFSLKHTIIGITNPEKQFTQYFFYYGFQWQRNWFSITPTAGFVVNKLPMKTTMLMFNLSMVFKIPHGFSFYLQQDVDILPTEQLTFGNYIFSYHPLKWLTTSILWEQIHKHCHPRAALKFPINLGTVVFTPGIAAYYRFQEKFGAGFKLRGFLAIHFKGSV